MMWPVLLAKFLREFLPLATVVVGRYCFHRYVLSLCPQQGHVRWRGHVWWRDVCVTGWGMHGVGGHACKCEGGCTEAGGMHPTSCISIDNLTGLFTYIPAHRQNAIVITMLEIQEILTDQIGELRFFCLNMVWLNVFQKDAYHPLFTVQEGGLCPGDTDPTGHRLPWRNMGPDSQTGSDIIQRPPCEQNDWQTGVKTLPSGNFVRER